MTGFDSEMNRFVSMPSMVRWLVNIQFTIFLYGESNYALAA